MIQDSSEARAEAPASLWKLHGDVQRLEEDWIFPYDTGKVFDSLIASLEVTIRSREPSHVLIVGYSEWEVVVRERLITWLEQHVPTVLRVRPTWSGGDGGITDTAWRFFQRLHTTTV